MWKLIQYVCDPVFSMYVILYLRKIETSELASYSWNISPFLGSIDLFFKKQKTWTEQNLGGGW
jgi:hypothetical protein